MTSVAQTEKAKEQEAETEQQPTGTSMSFQEEAASLLLEFTEIKKAITHSPKQPFVIPDEFEKDID